MISFRKHIFVLTYAGVISTIPTINIYMFYFVISIHCPDRLKHIHGVLLLTWLQS